MSVHDRLTQALRDEAEAHEVDVEALYGQVLARLEQPARPARARNPRARGVLIAAVVVAVAGIGLGGLVLEDLIGEQPVGGPPLADAKTSTVGAWMAGSTLYVGDTHIAAEGAQQLVGVPSGAVYATESGDVIWARTDASIDVIGHKSPDSALVSDPSTGWVAWVDETSGEGQELILYDTEAGAELARHALPTEGPRFAELDAGAYPIALDQGVVYYAALDDDYRWDVQAGAPPEPILPPDRYLLDHQAGVQLTRPDYDARPEVYLDRVGANTGQPASLVLPLGVTGNALSPDGRYLLHLEGRGTGRAALYDTRTGQRIEDGLPRRAWVLQAAFGLRDTVTYAVKERPSRQEQQSTNFPAPAPLAPGGPVDLVTCELATGSCRIVIHHIPAPVTLATGAHPVS